MKQKWINISLLIMLFVFSTITSAQDDQSSETKTNILNYKFDAKIYKDILKDVKTELWGQLILPDKLPEEKLPLIIFLHGNHGTCGRGTNPRIDDSCEYTMTGQCPAGKTAVPSHKGYNYVGEELAKLNYIVLSINANRGITCNGGDEFDRGLNLARGRLILKHIELLSKWNKGIQNEGSPTPDFNILKGKIDFSSVGLVGHSRGGEGVRAAYNFYRGPWHKWQKNIGPMNIKAIFEIAPVDGQSGIMLNPENTAWNVLLPLCDGDVSNMQGIRVFDRMISLWNRFEEKILKEKSAHTVWGANHNSFNTEWQISDSLTCVNHTPLFSYDRPSIKQQSVLKNILVPFFELHIRKKKDNIKVFNPLYALPDYLQHLTPISRNYIDGISNRWEYVIEDFFERGAYQGIPVNKNNVEYNKLDRSKEHSLANGAGVISWDIPSKNTFIQFNFYDRYIQEFNTLNFRIHAYQRSLPREINFSLAIMYKDDTTTRPIQLNNHTALYNIQGGHELLQSVIIPLSTFQLDISKEVKGVRFIFNDSDNAKILLANLRFGKSKYLDIMPPLEGTQSNFFGQNFIQYKSLKDRIVPKSKNKCLGFMYQRFNNNDKSAREAIYHSAVKFMPKDELLKLKIGEHEFSSSTYPDSENLNTVKFNIPANVADKINIFENATITYGDGSLGKIWKF